MLTYFPTPYPNEWWYSVLCRYYVGSGIKEHSIVKERLFTGNKGAHMGVLFPNGTVAKVIDQLPKGVFDTRETILNHTPFLYYTRMYPVKERVAMLDALCRGETVQLTHLWKSFQRASWKPRYCPVCVEEDKLCYGEPYWHVDHQIPLMSVCTKHHCRLQQIDLDKPYPTLNQQFLPLANIRIRNEASVYQTWEEEISNTVRTYWKLPLSVGPTEHSNLAQLLKDKGYMTIYRQGTVSLDPRRLYTDLCAFYGDEMIKRCFGRTLDASMVNRIVQWKQLLPDRYILLQTMIGAETKVVFDEKALPDRIREKLVRMAAEGTFCTMKQVAEMLHVRPYELNTLIRYYEIEPFWMSLEKRKNVTARTALIRCSAEQDEFNKISQRSSELGYHAVGAYILDCVRYVMGQNDNGKN